MKKILTISVIAGLFLFSSCSFLNKIGTGSSVKLFSICNKATSAELDSVIVSLFNQNIITSNVDEYYDMIKQKASHTVVPLLDSVRKYEKKHFYTLDYLNRKHFLCYLSSINAFYGLDVCNCGLLCSGCDLNISTIIMNEVSDYDLTWKEKKQALLAFEREILPLIRANVERIGKEKK